MSAEQVEKIFLKSVLEKVDTAIYSIEERIRNQQEDIRKAKIHFQEHKRDMDHLDKNAFKESVAQIAMLGEASVGKLKRLSRIKEIPYFARMDFAEEEGKSQSIYVGVHNFRDEDQKSNLIFDWRAPISSMFYDFEPGPAFYQTLEQRVEGEISLKRQFRIRDGEMEYMLDSDVTIQDEVLQKELNRSSSGKMKNIVATIQREQNKAIRNEDDRHLIIQGVAGSGKTSIALHRIAFLLYKFKDTISSDDILIISPNKVFASYISNVLPELGEETVRETSMEDLALKLFDHQINFQSFNEQVAELLKNPREDFIDRIRFKSSEEILEMLDKYLIHLENTAFKPEDIFVNKKPVPAWFIEEKFQQYNRMPLLKRFNEVVSEIVNNVSFYYKYQIMGKERTDLHQTIRNMFPSTNLRKLYKNFYEWVGNPELLKLKKGATYEYSDVFPLLYLKMKLEGYSPFSEVKHLIVDEMQDYSPVQYKVLSLLFFCNKTILGDINQSVNPFSASNLETIQTVFPDANGLSLLKSYRSTFEIIEFTRRINPDLMVEAIERHGSEPGVHALLSREDELVAILKLVKEFENSPYQSLGVICKTRNQAKEIHDFLIRSCDFGLLDASSSVFKGGKVVTTAHLAKGLEFDMVIVPMATQSNFNRPADRQMLYVAATRAMHRLEITHTGKISGFLE